MKLHQSSGHRFFFMQHGFMKDRSTVTNLVEFSNFVNDKIKNGHQVDLLFTGLCFELMRSFSGMILAWFWSSWVFVLD
jgi:hypothetical protein